MAHSTRIQLIVWRVIGALLGLPGLAASGFLGWMYMTAEDKALSGEGGALFIVAVIFICLPGLALIACVALSFRNPVLGLWLQIGQLTLYTLAVGLVYLTIPSDRGVWVGIVAVLAAYVLWSITLAVRLKGQPVGRNQTQDLLLPPPPVGNF